VNPLKKLDSNRGTRIENNMRFLRRKTLKDNHVLFSSPKGAKHERLKAREKNIEAFVFLSLWVTKFGNEGTGL